VANRLVEVKNGMLTCFGGNYDFYLRTQESLERKQMKAYELQEEERALLKQKIKSATFSAHRANAPKDRNIMAYDKRGEQHQKSLQRNLDVLKARLAEIEANPLPHPRPKSITGLRFFEEPLPSSFVVELEEVTKAFDEKVLFSGLNKMIGKGDRIVLTGPNGSGKTTLLRCIANRVALDAGHIRLSPGVKIGFLDQEVELLPMDQTPFQYFAGKFGLSEEDLRRELHKAALCGADLLSLPFSALSAGQRKRLMLLSLILEKPNLLLLDEPTNHLDFLTLEAFERALMNFEGAILAISHDRAFIEKVATQEWKMCCFRD
jgi:ATPase subunit of ABC transporter with duplicated ATPase domains